MPPLRYELVHRLKRDFPQLTIVHQRRRERPTTQIAEHLRHVDGVMVGREAYHHPGLMADWDARFFGDAPRQRPTRDAGRGGDGGLHGSARRPHGTPWAHAARHMLGLWNGQPGARRWRQVWCDHRLKSRARRRPSCAPGAPRRRRGGGRACTGPAAASITADAD